LAVQTTESERVVSGMRPTGQLHLGHYHGVLKNWQKMQLSYECFFFVADWHALTTHYDETADISSYSLDMVIDWLAAGIMPGSAHLFVQSHVPEHAELHLLLSMVTPLSWLERVPSYKDQQEKLKEKDLATYGFLGYPLLQSADILIYKGGFVPVGEDQVAHVEMTREVARRFNYIYGNEPDFAEKAEKAIAKMAPKSAKLYKQLRKQYTEQGDQEALPVARALLEDQQSLSLGDKERLYGYLEGTGKIILPEPQALLTEQSKLTGLDGQKMSKSYNNIIALREDPKSVEQKIKTMPTDPARVRRSDPGNPEKCPVWSLHKVYSNDEVKKWVVNGCTTAGIGCIECKRPVIDAVQAELKPMRERALEYVNDKSAVLGILEKGAAEAREIARNTLEEVRKAMGLVGK
jgi:tryptophanyl-tRNA synthetase